MHSVIEYQNKFINAEEIIVVKHLPIYPGEKVVEELKLTLSEMQKGEINQMFEEIRNAENLSYQNPMPLTRSYDTTILLKYKTYKEIVTISQDRKEVIAQNPSKYLEPDELTLGLSRVIDSFINASR